MVTNGPKHKVISGKVRKINGWRKQPPDHRDKLLAVSGPVPSPPRTNNKPDCTPVEDQGDIGSCTANSTTSAMEYLLKKLGRPVLNFSRLFVYYYSRKVEGTPPTEDSGCVIRSVMKTLAFFGAPPEKIWPYDIDKFSIGPSYAAIKAAREHLITRYYRCPSLESIKKSMALGFTCVGGFQVPENMMTDECERSGAVKYPSPTEGFDGGHAVHFVDYDDDVVIGKEKGALIFQNSWGTSWGKSGFGVLPYRFVSDGLADDFWTIRAET